jgi:hypothetical protein
MAKKAPTIMRSLEALAAHVKSKQTAAAVSIKEPEPAVEQAVIEQAALEVAPEAIAEPETETAEPEAVAEPEAETAIEEQDLAEEEDLAEDQFLSEEEETVWPAHAGIMDDETLLEAVRSFVGEAVTSAYTDSYVLEVTRSWVDYPKTERPSPTDLIEWLAIYSEADNLVSLVGGTSEQEKLAGAVAATTLVATYLDATRTEQDAEFEVANNLPPQDGVHEELVKMIDESIAAAAPAQPEPEVIEPFELEDLTPRQMLQVAADIMSQRSSEELHREITQLLAKVYGMRFNDPSDVLVALAQSQRYVDFLLTLLSNLQISVNVTAVSSSYKMESRMLTFENMRQQYSALDLEKGVHAGVLTIKRLLAAEANRMNENNAAKTKELELQNKFTSKSKELNETKQLLESLQRVYDTEQKKPKPVTHNAGGSQPIFIRWTVKSKDKKTKQESEITYYLTKNEFDPAKRLVSSTEGRIKLADFNRTKDIYKALYFASVDDAKATIERLAKNISKLSPEAKIFERTMQVAKVVSLFELVH